MNWFYAVNDQQLGPVSEADLQQLLNSGQINRETLVWHEGMADWQPLGVVRGGGPPPVPGTLPCAECGRSFPAENLVQLNRVLICAQCKPIYLQKMSEGVAIPSAGGAMWRSGKQLVTVSETPFPDRCVKCNRPANGYRLKRRLYWHHPALYLIVLINLLIYALIAIAVRKKALLHVGLCETHRTQRKQIIWIAWLGALGGLALAIFGGITFQSGWPVLIGIVLLLGFLIYGAVKAPMVAAAKITKDNVWLRGVHQDFMANLPNWMGS